MAASYSCKRYAHADTRDGKFVGKAAEADRGASALWIAVIAAVLACLVGLAAQLIG